MLENFCYTKIKSLCIICFITYPYIYRVYILFVYIVPIPTAVMVVTTVFVFLIKIILQKSCGICVPTSRMYVGGSFRISFSLSFYYYYYSVTRINDNNKRLCDGGSLL